MLKRPQDRNRVARPRKTVHIQHKHGDNNETSSSASSESSVGTRTIRLVSRWKTAIGFICLIVAVYAGTLGYLETRVNTPFDDEKVVQETGLQVPERYWGTYRPGVYVGVKSREPRSPVFGLMWYELGSRKGIRHWCDQNDNLPTYGYMRHDGASFGEQRIVDPPYVLTTSFVRVSGERGGVWSVRVNVTATGKPTSPFALVWYGALDESLGPAVPQSRLWAEGGALLGHTPQLDNFKVSLMPYEGKVLHKSYSEAHAPGLHVLKEKLYSLLRSEKHGALGRLPALGPDDEMHEPDKEVNFLPYQLIVEAPFVLDIMYTTGQTPTALRGHELTRTLEERRRSFDERFEETYGLGEKGYSKEDISIAAAALSNTLGGVGYFYGAGRVRSQHTREPVPYWRAPLYTAVPSRSFFPRGFLWDEGFHGLLIGSWAPEIQLDVAAHWLDLINVEGWIPREQILGAEALARVPAEFVVQSNAAANPPMLLVTLARAAVRRPQLFRAAKNRATLARMFPRLQAWYQWFQSTQRGEEPTSYRWRGREDDGLQLNPKSLSSGLDDYPRASHPSDQERHVDLRCWMYAAADAMATLAAVLDRDGSKFEATRDQLGDEDLLNELHWSTHTKTYADYGLHTDGVRLIRAPPPAPGAPAPLVRAVTTPPQPRLVTSAYGYISLFPMLLRVLQPSSERLGDLLGGLDRPEHLWSPYGLRSLSKSAPLYMKRNTEHDPPYWRGQVWININYLALSALKHYATQPGPYRERAGQLHDKLRSNVIGNLLSEYKRTGYFWEQYSGEDGQGSGCRPFTGWTALLVLIMAEEY